LKAKHYFEGV